MVINGCIAQDAVPTHGVLEPPSDKYNVGKWANITSVSSEESCMQS